MVILSRNMKLLASLTAVALVPAASLATSLPPVPQICDRDFARQILASRDYLALCGCETVTTAFLREIRNSPDIANVLEVTDAYCPGLSNVLTPIVEEGPSDNGPEPDGGDRPPSGPPPGNEPPDLDPPNNEPPDLDPPDLDPPDNDPPDNDPPDNDPPDNDPPDDDPGQL